MKTPDRSIIKNSIWAWSLCAAIENLFSNVFSTYKDNKNSISVEVESIVRTRGEVVEKIKVREN